MFTSLINASKLSLRSIRFTKKNYIYYSSKSLALFFMPDETADELVYPPTPSGLVCINSLNKIHELLYCVYNCKSRTIFYFQDKFYITLKFKQFILSIRDRITSDITQDTLITLMKEY